MAKFFNTAGPIHEADHYFIPVAQRINVDEILTLIDQKKYFVLHAPRQSGKTTTLLELVKILNNSGKYKCFYVNVGSAQTSREKVGEAMTVIVNELIDLEKLHLPGDNIISRHGALNLAYDLTNGQPWLVNALAYEACFKNMSGKNRSQDITAAIILADKESLIVRRVTHLDLADMLKEPLVRRVIEPLLVGTLPDKILQSDIEYVTDLGLETQTFSGLIISNPIQSITRSSLGS